MKNIASKICLCISIVLCMLPNILNAQSRKPMNLPTYDNEIFRWGIAVGLNQTFFTIDDYKDNFQDVIYDMETYEGGGYSEGSTKGYKINNVIPGIRPISGITIGCIGNLRLAKYFDLRYVPSFSYVDKVTYYECTLIENDNTTKSETITKQTNHVYIEPLTLQIKYKSKRYNNIAAYVIAGANYRIDVYTKKKDGKIQKSINKRQDIAAEIGAGFDFYTEFFKLGIEAKMSYGLLNVRNNDYESMFTNSFNTLRNKTFQLSFTFE